MGTSTLKAGVRQRIISAAKAEFAAHGSKAASVRSIASRAGVTAAMINYYYGSKQALYDLIVEQAQARLLSSISLALAESEQEQLPARLAAAYFDFLAEERDFQRLLAREVLDRGEAASDFVSRHLVPLRAMFEDLFGRDDAALQAAISVFGAVAGYFLYEPVMAQLLGDDAVAAAGLARRREHIMELASMLAAKRR